MRLDPQIDSGIPQFIPTILRKQRFVLLGFVAQSLTNGFSKSIRLNHPKLRLILTSQNDILIILKLLMSNCTRRTIIRQLIKDISTILARTHLPQDFSHAIQLENSRQSNLATTFYLHELWHYSVFSRFIGADIPLRKIRLSRFLADLVHINQNWSSMFQPPIQESLK